MQQCEQTSGQSIYDHGLSVARYIDQIISGDTSDFRLPQWFDEYREDILSTAHDPSILRNYAVWHDCGKPFCLTVDEQGKRHFPNHAEISYDTWMTTFASHSNCEEIGSLIRHDMIMHTMKYEDIIGLGLSNRVLCSLLISALAELHSNAAMFGGIESDSFKIKWKRYDKLGRKLTERMFNHKHIYVVTRRDLSIPQRAVQSGHALIETTRHHLTRDDQHPSVIICAERDEVRLRRLQERWKERGIEFQSFYEPMFNNELTAIASRPMAASERHHFKSLQLIKGE